MKELKLADYCAPPFQLKQTDLTFELDPGTTKVCAKLHFTNITDDIFLNGVELKLESLHVDGEAWKNIETTDTGILLKSLPAQCLVEIRNTICPEKNTSLDGLYQSGGRLFTQNEPEGFRRVTYYPDRPDVMSTFQATLIGDSSRYPVMLSNGDMTESVTLEDGRQKVVWSDPHPKPCYLFALVAGDFAILEDSFQTRSGDTVKLQFYSEKERIDQCHFAMQSLKRAMKWDEERFGLEYDLATYMVVVVDDFNGGAMENKGLNLFNTRYVLANPEITTDAEYDAIEGVVGHEYFHNWTGNRVTLRDWFHLSLKEGLTVFRDQEFSSDLHSRGVVRVETVQRLWELQFAEDAGPNAHAVRPEQALAVENFFSATIYEKGAEVIRMIFAMLGKEDFRKGLTHYLETYDGQAVTIEEFVTSFEQACGADLKQFRHWYTTPGTPRVHVERKSAQTVSLRQESRRPEGEEPLDIPISYACFAADGSELETGVWRLNERQKDFTIPEGSIPSLLRQYSAPVILKHTPSREDRALLIMNESDMFQVWMNIQELQLASAEDGNFSVLCECVEALLKKRNHDPLFLAKTLDLPNEGQFAERLGVFDPETIFTRQNQLAKALGKVCQPLAAESLSGLHLDADYDANKAAERALNLKVLRYAIAADDDAVCDEAQSLLSRGNATALMSLAYSLLMFQPSRTDHVLQQTRDILQRDDFTMNKYYQLLAMSMAPETLSKVKQEMQAKPFQLTNPNYVGSLIGTFSRFNLTQFHTGEGYRFLVESILKVDALNPQTAARLCRGFERYPVLRPDLKAEMKSAMEQVANTKNISANVLDLTRKALEN